MYIMIFSGYDGYGCIISTLSGRGCDDLQFVLNELSH